MLTKELIPRAGRFLLANSLPLRYALDAMTFRWYGAAESLSPLKNAWRGKAALIVANGPSLNQTPLNEFCDVPSIGMNKIDLIFDRVNWRPSLIVCENNLVVKQHSDLFFSSKVPIYLSWKSRWFVPARFRDKFKYYLTRDSTDFLPDLTKGLGSASTVTYVALQFAYYLGADPVILVGCDHNFKFEGSPNNYKIMKEQDPNHFHPDYFAKGAYWGTPNLEMSERGYSEAKKAFEQDGRNVFDATIGGKLNIFKKIAMDQAIAYCRNRS